jgi:hypothetical protein
MMDCRRCVKFVGCKLRGDDERISYCEYYRRPAAWQIDGSALPAVPKRYSPVGDE